jgi:hypothetical protein
MATVVCPACNGIQDDMDSGACLACGVDLFEQSVEVFDNGASKPKKGLYGPGNKPISSSGRLSEDERWRILRDLDQPVRSARSRSAHGGTVICGKCGYGRTGGTGCLWCRAYMKPASSSGRRPQGAPLAPLPPGLKRSWREDWDRLDGITKALADAQELYERCLADWEAAQREAYVAQGEIDGRHMNERALDPYDRHQYVLFEDQINHAQACWHAYVPARDRYFRLLAEFAEVEKMAPQPSRSKPLKDPSDWYVNPRQFDPDEPLSLVEKRAEQDRQDRRADRGPAREVTVRLVTERDLKEPSRGFNLE